MNLDLSSALAEDHVDVYFLHARDILRAEGINPVVTVEVFPAKSGLLCGIREVLTLLAHVLPPSSEVWALNEGEQITAKEVVLRITAPYLSFAIYETTYLGILASESGWATAAREIVEAASPVPVISFGARHIHPNVSAQMEYAAIVGGCVTGATPAGAALAGKQPSGTMPHALILVVGDTLATLRMFDRHMPPDVSRVALVDTFQDEAEESLHVATGMEGKLWGVRLDTPAERGRVTPDLVKEVRARLDQAGFPNVKIFVSGGLSADRIRLFRETNAPVDGFGVGSAISSAPPIDFTADIHEIDGLPIAKRGRIPGVTPNPRLRRIALDSYL
jgi:nicotinate phosphoribosyltransferase